MALAEAKFRRALTDCLYFLTECTKTKDEQAQEGMDPYRPFPNKPYIPPILKLLQKEPIQFFEKSRTMMLSWSVSGWAGHYGFTHPATKVVFQSQDEDRAVNDVNYVKELWKNSDPIFRERWPLKKAIENQPKDSFALANGSEFVAIVGNPDKVRSAHPTIYVLDEAAHVEQGEDSWNIALATKAPHMIALSSAAPGWFADMVEFSIPCEWPTYAIGNNPISKFSPCPGLTMRRMKNGVPVVRVHYTADPDKDAAWVAVEQPKFSSVFWDQEMDIKYHARSGQRVYPEFDQAIHVVPDSEIPKKLTRYMSIDPHPRTPHAMLWVGIDAWSDWYVYRELWPSIVSGVPRQIKDEEQDNSFTIREYVETIATLEGNSMEWRNAATDNEWGILKREPRGERIVYRFMDQAGKGFQASSEAEQVESYSTRYDRYGIRCRDPRKAHKSGEDAIRDLLKLRRHETKGQWPRIHIAASCSELALEFSRYRYKPTKRWSDERELKQEGVEARCHLLDNLRYLCTAQIGYIPSLAS